MTRLTKDVVRFVPAGRRGLVVTLSPNGTVPVLTIRERGRREGFSVTVEGLYHLLARKEADRVVGERRSRRIG